jgi:hypothetical protein
VVVSKRSFRDNFQEVIQMTIKSALTVVALAAGLVAVPAFAQTAAMPTMIGSLTVPEAEAGAVKARCDELKVASETESLVSVDESEDDDAESTETEPAGDAAIVNVPATDGATAVTVDLDVITLEDCEAGGWFEAM